MKRFFVLSWIVRILQRIQWRIHRAENRQLAPRKTFHLFVNPSFLVPAPKRSGCSTTSVVAEPLSIVLNMLVYPFLRPRCERVEEEDGSFVVNENVRRD
jgi:hypothetical protein